MSFFQLVPEEQMTLEARQYADLARTRLRVDQLGVHYHAMAAHPQLLKAFVQAFADLLPIPNRFGTSQFIVSMLIAHAKGCAPCFNASRGFLLKIGIDEAALDAMCSRPEDLPLSDRERHFVEFTLRVARDPSGLKPADFQEMERLGFSKDEILEMIGVAGFWSMATTVTSAIAAGLDEE
jgi:alkylhydroperoxidase family enzyme